MLRGPNRAVQMKVSTEAIKRVVHSEKKGRKVTVKAAATKNLPDKGRFQGHFTRK